MLDPRIVVTMPPAPEDQGAPDSPKSKRKPSGQHLPLTPTLQRVQPAFTSPTLLSTVQSFPVYAFASMSLSRSSDFIGSSQ